jgi:hypothetical protein
VRLWNDIFVSSIPKAEHLLTFGQALSFEYVPKFDVELVSWDEYPERPEDVLLGTTDGRAKES